MTTEQITAAFESIREKAAAADVRITSLSNRHFGKLALPGLAADYSIPQNAVSVGWGMVGGSPYEKEAPLQDFVSLSQGEVEALRIADEAFMRAAPVLPPFDPRPNREKEEKILAQQRALSDDQNEARKAQS